MSCALRENSGRGAPLSLLRQGPSYPSSLPRYLFKIAARLFFKNLPSINIKKLLYFLLLAVKPVCNDHPLGREKSGRCSKVVVI